MQDDDLKDIEDELPEEDDILPLDGKKKKDLIDDVESLDDLEEEELVDDEPFDDVNLM